MFEDVFRSRGPPSLVEELVLDQLPESDLELRLPEPDNGVQNLVGKFTPKHCSHLCDFTHCRCTVQAGHERVLQSTWDLHLCQRALQYILVCLLRQTF